ncbi:MAG: hypothetical protein K0R00_158 [Herbinix sp.]|jgi:hypothetical protein|nr:hypothetical protein [Herbinix sp.]
MIKAEQRFDEYAYRVSDEYLSDSVTTLEEGQWVTFNASGELVVADGTVKAFLAIGSKRPGRDQVSGVPVKKIPFLHGAFRLATDQFDPTGTYTAVITPLKVMAGGILTPWASATDSADKLVAYAKGAPVDGMLKIFSA